jgi:acetyl-CoA carboxylase biotin carboxyl carrier protein
MPQENVLAHITGTVWKVECKIGDDVRAGDILVILESMKMELPIEEPRDGRIAEILVGEGQAVVEGAPVLVLDV